MEQEEERRPSLVRRSWVPARPPGLAWLHQLCVAGTNRVARKFEHQVDESPIAARGIWLELQLATHHDPEPAGEKSL